MSRILAAFSCGDASAVAVKEAVAEYGNLVEPYYCDTFKFEHPDNRRFFNDVQDWIGRPITILRSDEYEDIYDVFDRTGWLIGPSGARCTSEMKQVPRKTYQRPDDVHILGFTAEEGDRVANFHNNNPEVRTDFILYRKGITKGECHYRIRKAGIKLPAMYLLGYRNNNCIGCVKGGMGYWNKIRRDFPDMFAKMAAQERKMGVTILSKRRGKKRTRLYLDELDPKAGRYEAEPDIECGVQCVGSLDDSLPVFIKANPL